MKQRQSLWFTAPRTVELRDDALHGPAAGEVLVRTTHSAISPGTEMLVYRDHMPALAAADASIAALAGALGYPLKYGYTCVGEVIAAGDEAGRAWLGRRVFAFNPHESMFVCPAGALQAIPDDASWEDALLLPAAETAVNFVHDGAPLFGERAAVIGAGLIGQMTLAALAQFPLAALVAFDPAEGRRAAALRIGAREAFAQPTGAHAGNFDVVFEVSGVPDALNSAISLCAYSGRVVVGSWYGSRRAELDLGGWFHRNRIQLVSSQVSSLAPALEGRWTKARRMDAAWSLIRSPHTRAITREHTPFANAARAYDRIDRHAGAVAQFVFDYESNT